MGIYTTTNNAQAPLKTGISASAVTVVLETGCGDLFPTTFPFRGTIEKFDASGRVIKRNIVECTGRSGDILTIVRGVEACPISWDATTQVTTGLSFDAGDIFTHGATSGMFANMQADIANKLDKAGGTRTGFGSNKHVRVSRSTGLEEVKNVTDGSSIASTDKIRFEKLSGDYEDMPVSLLQNAISGMTSEYIMGGSANTNESVYISTLNKWRNTTTPLADIGKTVAKTTFRMFSSGNAEQRFTFYFTKTGTPQDLTFRIETDDGSGNASGTLVNANAVLVSAIAGITSDAVYEIVLPASFNLGPVGTPIHFVFWQGSQYVNASNYLSIGVNDEVCVVHDRVTSPGSNLSTSRTITGGAGTTSSGTQSTQVDCIADCQLVSISSWYQVPTVTLFEVFNVTDNISIYKDPTTQSGVTLREPVKLLAGKRYELRYTFTSTLNNISGYTSLSNTAHLQWVNGTAGGNSIQGITTRTATFTPNSATLSQYISKANATNSIKSNVYAMLPQSASAGSYPSIVKDRYLGGFSNLTKNAPYYLSNSGVLSSTPGTISKTLGVAINSTTIRIDSAINAS